MSRAKCVSGDCISRIREYGHFEKWGSREHQTYQRGTSQASIDLEGAHKGEASRQLIVESRSMMTSSVRSKCSSLEMLLGSLWEKDKILWCSSRITFWNGYVRTLVHVCSVVLSFDLACYWAVSWELLYTWHTLVSLTCPGGIKLIQCIWNNISSMFY